MEWDSALKLGDDDGMQRIELDFVEDTCALRLDVERVVNCSEPITIPFAMYFKRVDENEYAFCGVPKRRRGCRECACVASPKDANDVRVHDRRGGEWTDNPCVGARRG